MSEERGNMLHGVLLIALFSCAAFYIGDFPWVKSLSFSPMIVGLGLTLYFLSRAVRSMMRTVNDIYHVEISRGMVKDVLISFGITAGFLVSVVCSFVLVVAGRTIIRVVPK